MGSLPPEQNPCEIQLNIIKSSGSQLPTETAALWAAFLLPILMETVSHGKCGPWKMQSIFSANKLRNTKLHLSSKHEQNATFTYIRARSQLFRLNCFLQKMTTLSKKMYLADFFQSLTPTTVLISIFLNCCIGFNHPTVVEVFASK